MNKEKQRIAIAEACGWKVLHGQLGITVQSPDRNAKIFDDDFIGEVETQHALPDYLNDLNAMHDAEKTLAPIKIPRYTSEIWAAMCKCGKAEEMDIGVIHATAAQRAEAFLRTIGKWEQE